MTLNAKDFTECGCGAANVLHDLSDGAGMAARVFLFVAHWFSSFLVLSRFATYLVKKNRFNGNRIKLCETDFNFISGHSLTVLVHA
ncbi:hypothetical protein HMPREF1148_0683 [Selenomonas sp. FOBRC6]|nr:hypothetical protein HMPREF1148_0683 [Selenomonas sp. FOBRC6]